MTSVSGCWYGLHWGGGGQDVYCKAAALFNSCGDTPWTKMERLWNYCLVRMTAARRC